MEPDHVAEWATSLLTGLMDYDAYFGTLGQLSKLYVNEQGSS